MTAAAILLGALWAGGSPPPAPFGDPVHVALSPGQQPAALAAADFNLDGKTDVAVASEGTGDVTMLLNDGAGRLRPAGSVACGPHPTALLAADLDRDGKTDLAVANHETSFVTLLRSDGKGGLRPFPFSPLTVHTKPHPHAVDACDANGDGWPDLIVDDWQENSLTLILSDGRGGFRGPGMPVAVGRKPYRNLRAADLDGDGKCDLVAPSYDAAAATVLVGDGHGGFRARAPLPAGPAPFAVAIADVNRDGRSDLVFTNYSGQITDPSRDALTFLLGDGRGGFRPGPRIATGRGPFDVATGDVDGDGYADAATADYGSAALTVAFGGPEGLSPARRISVSVGRAPERVVLVDLTGDGRADAVASSSEGHDVTILLAR